MGTDRSTTLGELPDSPYRAAQALHTLITEELTVSRHRTLEEPVPLSEEELRLLEQMERALVEEDPKFASTLRGTTLRQAARRRALLAGFVFAVGVAVLMSGAISGWWWLGIVGFVIMLGSATVGLSALRGQQRAGADTLVADHPSGFGVIDGGRSRGRRGRTSRSYGSSGSFMEKMEARWRRRRERGF